MATPFVKPTVVTRRIPGEVSLAGLAQRLTGSVNFVRVGLPDSANTEDGDAIRKTRKAVKKSK